MTQVDLGVLLVHRAAAGDDKARAELFAASLSYHLTPNADLCAKWGHGLEQWDWCASHLFFQGEPAEEEDTGRLATVAFMSEWFSFCLEHGANAFSRGTWHGFVDRALRFESDGIGDVQLALNLARVLTDKTWTETWTDEFACMVKILAHLGEAAPLRRLLATWAPIDDAAWLSYFYVLAEWCSNGATWLVLFKRLYALRPGLFFAEIMADRHERKSFFSCTGNLSVKQYQQVHRLLGDKVKENVSEILSSLNGGPRAMDTDQCVAIHLLGRGDVLRGFKSSDQAEQVLGKLLCFGPFCDPGWKRAAEAAVRMAPTAVLDGMRKRLQMVGSEDRTEACMRIINNST